MFLCLISSLLLPTFVGASILKTERQQIKPQEQPPEKSYGVNRQGPGPQIVPNGYGYGKELKGYGYGPIDKNPEAKGYGNAFAYGHDKENKPGNGYGTQEKEKLSYGYGYGKNEIKEKKQSVISNIFSKIKNIFSFWKVK